MLRLMRSVEAAGDAVLRTWIARKAETERLDGGPRAIHKRDANSSETAHQKHRRYDGSPQSDLDRLCSTIQQPFDQALTFLATLSPSALLNLRITFAAAKQVASAHVTELDDLLILPWTTRTTPVLLVVDLETWTHEFAKMKARSWAVLIMALLVFANSRVAFAGEPTQNNLALSRPYRVSPAPNYATALGVRGNELTDGRLASGSYWSNGDAVGWSGRSPVHVTVDLATPSSVSHVRVHTASKVSGGSYFPSQILVFGSDAAGGFEFLGQSRLMRDHESTVAPSFLSIEVVFPARIVSEVLVVAYARGSLIYLSEVEVFGGAAGTPLSADRLAVGDIDHAATKHRRHAISELPDPKPLGPDPSRLWAMPLSASPTSDNNPSIANRCSVVQIDPWTLAADTSHTATRHDSPGRQLVALTGGHDYATWRIDNRTEHEAKIQTTHPDTPDVAIHFYALAFVQALNYAWVPDVVVPISGTVVLPPQSSLILLAEFSPRTKGHHSPSITIACNAAQINPLITITALEPDPKTPALHGNLWAYIHEPLHAPVAKALACNPGYLADIGVDTVVVHPDALRDTPERPTTLLRQYLRTYRNASRVLLAMDVKTRPWPLLDLPPDPAATALRGWWDWVESIAREEGVSGELLLYPIDEPEFEDVARLLKVQDLAKHAGIKARVYSTVEWKRAIRLGNLDVLQLHRPTPLSMLPVGRAEIQGYDTVEDGKLLSADQYYRRQGWQAFTLGLKGIGTWSLWDSTGLDDPATGWNPFGRTERDFGLLYSSPTRCTWPSRRLLAWRRGLEENRILRQCDKRGSRSGDISRQLQRLISDLKQGDVATTLAAVESGCLE
jgi:hypothetical protein